MTGVPVEGVDADPQDNLTEELSHPDAYEAQPPTLYEVLLDPTMSDEVRTILQHEKGLEEAVERKQARIDELEAQLAERSRVVEKIEDLPAKIRDEMTYQERRQRMLDQASLAERLKWKLTGVPVDGQEA